MTASAIGSRRQYSALRRTCARPRSLKARKGKPAPTGLRIVPTCVSRHPKSRNRRGAQTASAKGAKGGRIVRSDEHGGEEGMDRS